MTLLRSLSILGLMALTAGCAQVPFSLGPAPTADKTPTAFAETTARSYPPVALAMDQCRTLMLETEIFDFNAPATAAPEMRRRTLYAEAPQGMVEMARGMMMRPELPDSAAMIFEFDGEHNPVLWMKDTPHSLDMVFFDVDGLATYIEHGTEPYSERFLSPEEPEPVSVHVLELKSGQAEALDIIPGLTTLKLGPLTPCVFED